VKVQNLTSRGVDLEKGVLGPAEIADVESSPHIDGLVAAGVLAQLDAEKPQGKEGTTK
jgi:hypothetical protein